MINIRYPNITGRTEAEQIKQMEGYLRQLTDQLNWAFSVIENQNKTPNTSGNGTGTNVRR